MVIVHIALLIVSFYLLAIIVEHFFVISLDRISSTLRLPSDVAGATFMAVGSSAPELFVSLFAVLRPGGYANVGAGTIVGSAIFNILVIVGASATFRAATLHWQPVVRDHLFYSASIILLLLTFSDGRFSGSEALILVSVYGFYIISVLFWKRLFPYDDVDPLEQVDEEIQQHPINTFVVRVLSTFIPNPHAKNNAYLLTFGLAIIIICGLSYVLVESGVALGEALHINPTIIGLTVLAAGTSVPDLLSSIIVAKQGRGDMAVSNAVGSNVFDILIGLGLPWLIILGMGSSSIAVDTENLTGSIILLFATVVALFFLLAVRRWRIGRRAGLLLIGLYILYLIYAGHTALYG